MVKRHVLTAVRWAAGELQKGAGIDVVAVEPVVGDQPAENNYAYPCAQGNGRADFRFARHRSQVPGCFVALHFEGENRDIDGGDQNHDAFEPEPNTVKSTYRN